MTLTEGQGNPIEIPDELIDFYSKLAILQDEMYEKVIIPEFTVDEEAILQHQQDQKFWLQIIPFPEIEEGFQQNLKLIVEFIKEARPNLGDQMESFLKIIQKNNLKDIIEKAVWLDFYFFESFCEENEISAGLFVFLVENALRPYLRAWGSVLINYLDKNKWLKPNCPVCGQKAQISRLRPGDGVRMMFCSHCFTEWQYGHLLCPHCENQDPMSLNIITIQGDSTDQIYACEKCRGYIKTINERQGKQAGNMLVESARTFFLDILAEREGYINPSNDRTKYN